MKQRLVFSISILLTITAIFLVLAVFRLYTEAEKVQKSIFLEQILASCDQIVNAIDNALNDNYLERSTQSNSINNSSIDTLKTITNITKKEFLLDSVSQKIVGWKKIETIIENNQLLIKEDTTIFDTNYRKIFLYLSDMWKDNIDIRQFSNSTGLDKKESLKKDINLIEMDAFAQQLLQSEWLDSLISDVFSDIHIKDLHYDFAVYNAFTTQFVVKPKEATPEDILRSQFFFELKPSNKFITPHYLILYFPFERGIYFQMMGAITILIISLLLIVFIISAVTLYYLYRQKKFSDVRNDFVNNMTHEFKTPITTISLACEAMSDDSTQRDQTLVKSYISIIKEENVRLQNMVTNVLQLAQMKKGQLKMNFEKVDLHALLKNIMDNVVLQVNSNEGHIVLKLNAENAYIYADKNHIENAIFNLIDNSIKYSEKNPYIKIGTYNEKKYAVVYVEDNGIGISKNNLKRIFHEFYRVSKGNIHNNKGFGLGLDYVKKIVYLHNGIINVKSEIKQGSVFTIFIPLYRN